MAYTVTLIAVAEKQLRKLASSTQVRIVAALTELAENPRPVGCKKLGGDEGFYVFGSATTASCIWWTMIGACSRLR